MMRANRRDRDQTVEDDLFLIYFDPFLDQQRGLRLHGERLRGAGGRDSAGGGPRGRPLRRSPGRRLVDVLFDTAARIVGDGFAGGDWPFRSRASAIRSGRRGPRTGGGCRSRAPSEAGTKPMSGRPRRGTSPASCPQMGLLDGMTGLSRSHHLEMLPTVTVTRFGALDRATGRFGRGGPVTGRRRQRQVRGHVEPHRRRHVQPRLLADRIGPAADRGQQRFALFYPERARSSWRGPRSSISGRRSPPSTPEPSSIRRTAPS